MIAACAPALATMAAAKQPRRFYRNRHRLARDGSSGGRSPGRPEYHPQRVAVRWSMQRQSLDARFHPLFRQHRRCARSQIASPVSGAARPFAGRRFHRKPAVCGQTFNLSCESGKCACKSASSNSGSLAAERTLSGRWSVTRGAQCVMTWFISLRSHFWVIFSVSE